jgi:RecA-family ATPase
MNTNLAEAHFLDAGAFDPSFVPEPEQPIFDGLLYRGDLAVWIGREKHRKSNLTLQMVISAALGRPFLHFRHGTRQPMRVVILDYESRAASFQRRYEAICRAMGLSDTERATLRTYLHVLFVRELRKKRIPVPRFPVRVQSKDMEQAGEWWERFAKQYPADLYLFDPMRCLHAQDENDSTLEALLSKLRDMFPNAALVIPHHMNRASLSAKESNGSIVTLSQPGSLRLFANGARGSSAINAHADVVICQEQVFESDVETVYLGAYMKDAADVEPLPLVESDHESFFWLVSRHVPEKLRASYETLRRAARSFESAADAVAVLMNGHGAKRATAYRHVKQLHDSGFLVPAEGRLAVGECSSEI